MRQQMFNNLVVFEIIENLYAIDINARLPSNT